MAVALACAEGDPEPGAVRLAALTAGAAADVLSDLAAIDDPDAAGIRDAFHAANVTALGNARLAHESAPRATQAAYALSLEASESADTFAQALSAAIEARDELAAPAEASHSATEAAALIAEFVGRRAAVPRLEAEESRLNREYNRLRDVYDKWERDNTRRALGSADEREAFFAEATRRRRPWIVAEIDWEAARAARAENVEALRFLIRALGQSDLSDL